MRVLPVVACLSFLPALVLAGTSGVGAAGDTARSLGSNPALAIGAQGTEAAGDLQSTLVFLTYKRAGSDADGDPYPRERAFLHGEVPYLAIRSDAFRGRSASRSEGGNLGLGFSLSLPFSSGANYSSDSAGRYHVIDATTYSAYLAPSVSFRPISPLRVGVAPVLAMSRLSVLRRLDLAPSLRDMLGEPGPEPESGLLEGEFRVKDATGFAPTYQIGTAWDFVPGRGTAGFSYTGGTLITLRGTSHFTPSLDFNVESTADFQYTQYLPPIANGGVRWRFTPDIAASFEAQWIGYSASKKAVSRIDGSKIHSSDQDLQSLLDFLGINEGQLVTGILDKEQTTYRGWQNAWNAVAGADYYMEKVRVHVEGGFFAHATPDQYVSTSNLDFDNYTVGATFEYQPVRRFAIALNVNQFFNNGRHVRNSRYDPTAGSDTGLAYPSGNGDYEVAATRVNVTTHVRF